MMRAHFLALVATLFLGLATVSAADRSVEPIVSRILRQPIESSAVAAVGYSRHLHALEIEFRDGLVYRYVEVPLPVYRALLSAESKARFYNQKIRGKYRCLRVRPSRTRANKHPREPSSATHTVQPLP